MSAGKKPPLPNEVLAWALYDALRGGYDLPPSAKAQAYRLALKFIQAERKPRGRSRGRQTDAARFARFLVEEGIETVLARAFERTARVSGLAVETVEQAYKVAYKGRPVQGRK